MLGSLLSKYPRDIATQLAINDAKVQFMAHLTELITLIADAESILDFAADPNAESFFIKTPDLLTKLGTALTIEEHARDLTSQNGSDGLVDYFLEAIATAKFCRLQKSMATTPAAPVVNA